MLVVTAPLDFTNITVTQRIEGAGFAIEDLALGANLFGLEGLILVTLLANSELGV